MNLRNDARGYNIGVTATLNNAFTIYDLTAGGTAHRLVIDTSGNVGIGTSTPSQKLTVAGNILATGSITQNSDVRYKQHIETIPQALTKITSLRGVSYQWKRAEYPQMAFSDRLQLGFIAQELKEVLPEAVH